jgi:hypothetical protein
MGCVCLCVNMCMRVNMYNTHVVGRAVEEYCPKFEIVVMVTWCVGVRLSVCSEGCDNI